MKKFRGIWIAIVCVGLLCAACSATAQTRKWMEANALPASEGYVLLGRSSYWSGGAGETYFFDGLGFDSKKTTELSRFDGNTLFTYDTNNAFRLIRDPDKGENEYYIQMMQGGGTPEYIIWTGNAGLDKATKLETTTSLSDAHTWPALWSNSRIRFSDPYSGLYSGEVGLRAVLYEDMENKWYLDSSKEITTNFILFVPVPQYTVTLYRSADQGGSVFNQKTMEYSDTYTFPDYTREGYLFKGWATEPDGTPAYQKNQTMPIRSGGSYYAICEKEPEKYTVTASCDGSGTIAPAGFASLYTNVEQKYTITPDAGYFVSDVLVDGVSVGALTQYTFPVGSLGNHTIRAICTRAEAKIIRGGATQGYYRTLSEAIAQANSGDTIRTLRDVTLTNYINILKPLTMELGGDITRARGAYPALVIGRDTTIQAIDAAGAAAEGLGSVQPVIDGQRGALGASQPMIQVQNGATLSLGAAGGALRVANHEGSTGAIWVDQASSVYLGGKLVVTGNTESGAPVYVNQGSALLEGATIRGNTGILGGGVFLAAEDAHLTVNSGAIRGNSAYAGGGVYARGGSVAINAGTIADNAATLGRGVFLDGATCAWAGGTIADVGGNAVHLANASVFTAETTAQTSLNGVTLADALSRVAIKDTQRAQLSVKPYQYAYGTPVLAATRAYTQEELARVTIVGGTGATAWKLNSAGRLTAGELTITKQPEDIALVEGEAGATLAVAASAIVGAQVEYEWFSLTAPDEDTAKGVSTGKTGAVFQIPANTKIGSHYYFARVSATNAGSVESRVATVVVTKAADALAVNPTTLTLAPGDTASLEALNANGATPTWESEDISIATVDANGQVKAVAKGKARIIVRALGRSAACAITVEAPATNMVLVSQDATPCLEGYDVPVGKTIRLTPELTPAGAAYTKVIYRSSKTGVARVTQTGIVRGVKTGYATITATFVGLGVPGEATSTRSISVRVHVGKPVAKLSMPTSLTLLVGKSASVRAKALPATALHRSPIVYTSDDTNVATVSATGGVTGVSPGTATITATVLNGATASCVVRVCDPIATMSISMRALNVYIGETVPMTVRVTPATASASVKWSSTNTARVSVSSMGVATAKKAGVVTIKAVSRDGDARAATIKMNVLKPLRPVKIGLTLPLGYESKTPKIARVEAGTVRIVKSGKAKFTMDQKPTVTATFAASSLSKLSVPVGGTMTLTAREALAWTSADASVASVTANGALRANAPGSVALLGTNAQGKVSVIIVTVTA